MDSVGDLRRVMGEGPVPLTPSGCCEEKEAKPYKLIHAHEVIVNMHLKPQIPPKYN